MKKNPFLLAIPLAFLLGACLDNEEELEVLPDGRIVFETVSHGTPDDFADGYPLPLGAGWEPITDDARYWLENIAGDTGSAAALERMREIPWPGEGDEDELHMGVRRTFTSPREFQRYWSASSDPYRTAYLERELDLEVTHGEGRSVYVFEYTFVGRTDSHLEAIRTGVEELPETLKERLDKNEPLSQRNWRTITRTIGTAYENMAEGHARRALLVAYRYGEAALPTSLLEPLLGSARDAVAAIVTSERLMQIAEASRTDEQGAAELLADLEDEARQKLRAALLGNLKANGVGEEARNAVAYGLEWSFTSSDHTTDLLDEEFKIGVTLPGVVIDGNFEKLEGQRAYWSFDGQELFGQDRTLRAIAVLE